MSRNNQDAGPDGDIYRITHDWEGPERLSFEILTAVAAIKGKERTALPPLERLCDTDALNGLFSDTAAGASVDHCSLTFAGCPITIHRNGHVIFQSPRQD